MDNFMQNIKSSDYFFFTSIHSINLVVKKKNVDGLCGNKLPKVVLLLRNLIGACHFLAFQFSFAVYIKRSVIRLRQSDVLKLMRAQHERLIMN